MVAFQSAILLFFAAHFYSQEMAGIISIGYAISVFIYTIGRYGMRNFQATDVTNRYSFCDYLKSRYISIAIALGILVVYLICSVFLNRYTLNKSVIVFVIVIFRMIYAFEDVFCGHLQKSDRFVEGARIMTIREGLSLCIILLLMIFQIDLITVFLTGIITSIVVEVMLLSRIKSAFIEVNAIVNTTGAVVPLLKDCFPLALGTSLAIYLSNIPKYVTDWYMDDAMQAIVGYLILPVFTITLLNQFIYNPFIRDLGDLYYNSRLTSFYKKVFRQIGVIIITTVVIGILIMIAGIPILTFIYGVDLSAYEIEMIFFIIGGFLYALQYYLAIPVTVMKRQKYMVPGYVGAIILSVLLQKRLITTMGLKGVATIYVLANGIMTVYLLILLCIKIPKDTNERIV